MTKQKILIHSTGDQESITDIIIAFAEMGFDIKCAMTEGASVLKAERDLCDEEPSEPD